MNENMKFSFQVLVLRDLMQRGVIDPDLYSKAYDRLQTVRANGKEPTADVALATA